ncbi:hypothetical protein M011DRAFT_458033 [Sporormia fimetaria CBS 119925]|uniref:Uncharacterized protein n=1 Tax=Sporormia fimetaria CBS 119925 TaxID=1340428 RepID=A0A6A6VD79_9PLEO|nr:hypothetical protein M011DRAFT_458033 [Sporormia fimetaria CBS 119925]
MRALGALFLLFACVLAIKPSDHAPLRRRTQELDIRTHNSEQHSEISLFPRAPQGGQGGRKKKECKDCKRCTGNTVRHRRKCRLCVPCPAKTKADPTHQSCVPQTADGKKPQDKKQRFDDKKKQRRAEFKEKKFENFDKKLGKAKTKYQSKQQQKKQEKEREKQEKERQRERERQKERNRERNARNQKRAGWCWAILAEGGAWVAADYEGVTQDDINGLTALWPEGVPEPVEAEIPEWVLDVYPKPVIEVPQVDIAGFAGIINAISKLFNAAKPAASEAFQALKNLKPAGRPSDKAIQGASKSGFVGKVLKDQRFRDCISATAGAAAAAGVAGVAQKSTEFILYDGETPYVWNIDFSRKKEDIFPSPANANGGKQIRVYDSTEEDGHFDPGGTGEHFTYSDYKPHRNRLQYERCNAVKTWDASGFTDNRISAIGVDNGCCAMYDDENCAGNSLLFTMANREDGNLKNKHNDAISGIWCTFNVDCTGRP